MNICVTWYLSKVKIIKVLDLFFQWEGLDKLKMDNEHVSDSPISTLRGKS